MTSTFQRVLVVGQSPGPKFDAPVITHGSTTGRLYEWLKRLELRRVSFVNACPDQGGALYCNADLDFLTVCYALGDYGAVITLGRTAAAAIEELRIDHFRLPHPSGRNRQLNDPEFVKEKLKRCRGYLERQGCT